MSKLGHVSGDFAELLYGNSVLIVDDDELFQKLIAHILQKHKLTSKSAKNGNQGLERLKEDKFDVVIADIAMPELDGIGFLRQMREFSKVPVVLTTAFEDQRSILEAKQLGVQSFLPKPFKEVELLTCLLEALGCVKGETQKFDVSRFRGQKDGVRKLTQVVEQAEPAMQEKIFAEIKKQDPQLADEVSKNMLTFDKVNVLDETSLTEVVSNVSVKILAYALVGQNSEFRDKCIRVLGANQRNKLRDSEDEMGKPQEHLIEGARRQIVKIIRKLEATGKLELEQEES